MSVLVTGIFLSRANARRAVKELRANGFPPESIMETPVPRDRDLVPSEALLEMGLSDEEASILRWEIAHNGTLVSVHAREGLASLARCLLEGAGPHLRD